MLCVPQYACKGWRTTCKSGFFPFTKWVVRTAASGTLSHLAYFSRVSTKPLYPLS